MYFIYVWVPSSRRTDESVLLPVISVAGKESVGGRRRFIDCVCRSAAAGAAAYSAAARTYTRTHCALVI